MAPLGFVLVRTVSVAWSAGLARAASAVLQRAAHRDHRPSRLLSAVVSLRNTYQRRPLTNDTYTRLATTTQITFA